MRRFGFHWIALALLILNAGVAGAQAAASDEPADFKEVYDLVRVHLRGLSPAELEQAAVQGLLTALQPRVQLLSNGAPAKATAARLVPLARTFEDNVAYVRIEGVEAGLAEAVNAAHRALAETNKPVGLVLDLRFADGDDYAAAVGVTGLFLKTEKAVLDWGGGVVRTKPAAGTIALPVAVLVNRQTTGAAEALAAALREAGAALILGGRTAGMAAMREEFPLKNGQKLLIATAPVKLANGTALSPQGVKPDIEVAVSREAERAYFADAYRELMKPEVARADSGVSAANPPAGTNRVGRRPRPNEADLVRARREGLPLDADLVTGREPEPPRAVVQDPALARAIDLLKGLAVVRSTRS